MKTIEQINAEYETVWQEINKGMRDWELRNKSLSGWATSGKCRELYRKLSALYAINHTAERDATVLFYAKAMLFAHGREKALESIVQIGKGLEGETRELWLQVWRLAKEIEIPTEL